MSENRSIQRLDPNSQRASAIMTPQGPAIIQVIDIPSNTGLGYPGNAGAGMPAIPGARKVGGINIVGAILRRWWLVLLVTAMIGGAGMYVAQNFVKPTFVAHCKISWIDRTPDGQGMARLIKQATDVLTSREIPLLAAADPRLQQILPGLVRKRDMTDPAVQADVVKQLKDIVAADAYVPTQTVDLQCARRDRYESAVIAHVFADAFVKFCENQLMGDLAGQIAQSQQLVEENKMTKAALLAEKQKLAVEYKFDQDAAMYANLMSAVSKVNDEHLAAKVQLAAAQTKLKELQNTGLRRAEYELQAIKLTEEEKAKDTILSTLNGQLVAAIGNLEQEKAGKKDLHPDVKRASDQVNRMKGQVAERETAIAAVIREKIDRQFQLMDAKNVAEANEKVAAANETLKSLNTKLAEMDEKAKKLVWVKTQLAALDDQIALVGREHDLNFSSLQELKRMEQSIRANTGLKVAEYPEPPDKPEQDKRVKVQAAGMVGGLFLGMLLALLVDRFDKRLRDPRDVEPLLGAPLLGTIPKINELKRIKGEHARNLIAEEFRIIRTQLLFGNPEMQHRVIAITSPQPGDGKTSLAVNLAISIAKAGRRVLLIDGDLRKPDIHRIFNIADSPGFAEIIAGSHEPGSCIRKSDIDGLDVLPAGTPIVRPSELLSRPEVSRVLGALSEVYDHIILDTAPLLPVSDTHVLVGIVDGVMCSFNAEVDRDTVTLVQEILRRSRANIIGTVMNQVKFKQSGSYYRGKSAYSSYYTSTRVPPANQLPGGGAAGGGDVASLS